MNLFVPKVVIVDNKSIDFPISKRLKKIYSDDPSTVYKEIEYEDVLFDRFHPFPKTLAEMKSTVVVTRKYGFQINKVGEGSHNPFDDYEFNIVTGCPNYCSYCMQLHVLRETPYIAVYPDLQSVMEIILGITHIDKKRPLIFDMGSMSDITQMEPVTGMLGEMIKYWTEAFTSEVQLQFITKSGNIKNLLKYDPKGAVQIGVTLNLPEFVHSYEGKTTDFEQRLSAIKDILAHGGYQLCLVFAPIFYQEGILPKYTEFFKYIKTFLSNCKGFEESDLMIEVLIFFVKKKGHREIIKYYPNITTKLLQHTQFSEDQDGKQQYLYSYPPRIYNEMKSFAKHCIKEYFPKAHLKAIR